MMSVRIVLLSIPLLFMTLSGLDAQTRTYAGSVSSAWQTTGKHGHDQPMCAEPRLTALEGGFLMEVPQCNAVDFARGNLDNSIGFRAGRERDVFQFGPVAVVAGVEGSFTHTEYNLSQADFYFATADVFTGLDFRVGPIVIGGRLGAGPFATSDGNERGFQHIEGAHITVPLHPGAALRITHQSMAVFRSERTVKLYDAPIGASTLTLVRNPRASETAILIVSSPDYLGSSSWEFSASTGTTSPGGPIGGSRMLRTTSYNAIAAMHRLPWFGLDGRITWIASAHESIRPTIFLGYDGNFRSKTIQGLGLGVSRSLETRLERLALRGGVGVEVADWRDDHQLLTRDGQPLIGGVETAIVLDAAARWQLRRNLAIEGSVGRAYWPGIDLGETRAGIGLVVTR